MTASAAHLLVVDDERPLREGLARYLRGRGFVVSEAADGTQALAALEQERYAVVICDVNAAGSRNS